MMVGVEAWVCRRYPCRIGWFVGWLFLCVSHNRFLSRRDDVDVNRSTVGILRRKTKTTTGKFKASFIDLWYSWFDNTSRDE